MTKKQWIKNQILVSAITLAVYLLIFTIFKGFSTERDYSFLAILFVSSLGAIAVSLGICLFAMIKEGVISAPSKTIIPSVAAFASSISLESISTFAGIILLGIITFLAALLVFLLSLFSFPEFREFSKFSKKFVWISLIAEFVIIVGVMNIVWFF